MNRLILIGNGFDLAHELPTSYCHFVTDYVANSINKFYENNLHSDPLLHISFKYQHHVFTEKPKPIEIGRALETLKHYSESPSFEVKYKSTFFRESLKNVATLNWVDLEIEYFEHLRSCKSNNIFAFDRVEKLNTEFEYLKNEFESYLKRIHVNAANKVFEPEIYGEIFCEDFVAKQIPEAALLEFSSKQIEILNFNYTSTVARYAEYCKDRVPTKINYIHGQLDASANPIIFGFGDEYDKDYSEFENFKNKSLFKHIKSFGYFKTGRYHELLRFLKSDEYQVYIIGHSCGLTDRTMLRQIFEHSNCKSIKIFYHERENSTNDFEEKTYQIYSHFTQKGEMRNKLVPLNYSIKMPKPELQSR